MSACASMVGGVVSTTVMLNESLAVLPCSSVVEQFTVVVPNGNVSPELASQVTGTDPSTRSVAEVEKSTAAPLGPVASTVRSCGRLRVGAVVSCTVMLNEPLLALPRVSVAEQITVVVPSENVSPEVASQVTGTDPSTRSVAEVEKSTAA